MNYFVLFSYKIILGLQVASIIIIRRMRKIYKGSSADVAQQQKPVKLYTRITLDTEGILSHDTEGKRKKALIRMYNLSLMLPYVLFWKKKINFQQFNGSIYSSTKMCFLLDKRDYIEQLWFQYICFNVSQYTWSFLLTK